MQKFCQKHQLTFVKQVNIKFLTGQFSLDFLSGKMDFLSDVKNEIFNTKGIAPHLQQLYYDNMELMDDGKISNFMTRMMTRESITLNLVVKPAQKVKLYINANFLDEQIEFETLETATVLDLKELLSAQSGIPTNLIVIIVDGFIDGTDSKPIWECSFENNIVQAYKRVIVYIRRRRTICREDHLIHDLETETVATLHKGIKQQYRCYSKFSKPFSGFPLFIQHFL